MFKIYSCHSSAKVKHIWIIARQSGRSLVSNFSGYLCPLLFSIPLQRTRNGCRHSTCGANVEFLASDGRTGYATPCPVTEATGLPLVSDIINTRRSALLGQMVRLGEWTPAHRAPRVAVGARNGCPHPHPWGDLAVGCVTPGSSRWCTRVHASKWTSGTGLCCVVMVIRHN